MTAAVESLDPKDKPKLHKNTSELVQVSLFYQAVRTTNFKISEFSTFLGMHANGENHLHEGSKYLVGMQYWLRETARKNNHPLQSQKWSAKNAKLRDVLPMLIPLATSASAGSTRSTRNAAHARKMFQDAKTVCVIPVGKRVRGVCSTKTHCVCAALSLGVPTRQ